MNELKGRSQDESQIFIVGYVHKLNDRSPNISFEMLLCCTSSHVHYATRYFGCRDKCIICSGLEVTGMMNMHNNGDAVAKEYSYNGRCFE